MERLWLILDSNYLVWRAHAVLQKLSHGEARTEVVFSYLRDLLHLQSLFSTGLVAHCFDKGRNKRKDLYPGYKLRAPQEPDTAELNGVVRDQIKALRNEYLPEIGAMNVFSSKGFEGDDMIASLVINSIPPGDETVIVSADKDLWQLLRHKVSVYNPRSKVTTTEKSFTKDWGLGPSQWSMVKAMAGCTSDKVDGIDGIGEKTAAKFLRGELKESSVAHGKIMQGEEVWKRNLPIVRLPLEGTETFTLVEDTLDQSGWERLTERFGLKSIRNLHRPLPFSGGFR